MLRFDKPIRPVVLYAYYLFCIFMNLHEPLKIRENHVKTIGLGEGLRYDVSCTPRAF